MSARITKAEVAFLFPMPQSAAAERNEALRLAGADAHQAAMLAVLRRLADRVLGWPARAQARAELRAMGAHELADIGLTRGEIDAAVDGRK